MSQNAFLTWMNICQQKGYWYAATMPSPVPMFEDHYSQGEFEDALEATAKVLVTKLPNWRIDDLISMLYEWPDS